MDMYNTVYAEMFAGFNFTNGEGLTKNTKLNIYTAKNSTYTILYQSSLLSQFVVDKIK